MSIRIYPHADIKSKWQIWLEESTVLTLVVLIAVFYFFPDIATKTVIRMVPQEIVTIENVVVTRQEVKPPPPPSYSRVSITESNVVNDEVNFSSELDINAEVAPTTIEVPKTNVEEEEEHIFEVVEDLPEPVGGISHIQNLVEYPELAKKAGVEGLVVVKAAIDRNGNVIKTMILKGIGGGCDEAAATAIQKTKFKPGMQRGIPVRVWVSIPIRFKLKN